MSDFHGIKMTTYKTLLFGLILVLYTRCRADTPTCDKDVKLTFLNGAMYMVAKAKYDYSGKAKDCAELIQMGHHEDNEYKIWPANRLYDNKEMTVYCNMLSNGGGWTVIQRRGDFGNPDNYFDQDWNAYKKGFGNLEKEFWLGNDKIFALTNQKLYTLRIVLRDVKNVTKYAEYDSFWIDDENNNYTLHISGYRGDAGDAMTYHHNNRPFSTKDRDNSVMYNCATTFSGGWWYNACHRANLNGLNLKGEHQNYARGIGWFEWKSYFESLAYAEMKIRPRTFKTL